MASKDGYKELGLDILGNTKPFDRTVDKLKKDAKSEGIEIPVSIDTEDITRALKAIQDMVAAMKSSFDKDFKFSGMKESLDNIERRIKSVTGTINKGTKKEAQAVQVYIAGFSDLIAATDEIKTNIQSLNNTKLNVDSFSRFETILSKIESLVNSIVKGLNFETIRPSTQIQRDIDKTTESLEKLKDSEKEIFEIEKYLNKMGVSRGRSIIEWGDSDDVKALGKLIDNIERYVALGGDLAEIKIDIKGSEEIYTLLDVVDILEEEGKINLVDNSNITEDVQNIRTLRKELEELNEELTNAKIKENRDLNVSLDTKSVDDFAAAIRTAVESIGNLSINIPEGFSLEGLSAENLDRIINKIGEIVQAIDNFKTALFTGVDVSELAKGFEKDINGEEISIDIKPHVDGDDFVTEIKKQLKSSGENGRVDIPVDPIIESVGDFVASIEEQLSDAVVNVNIGNNVEDDDDHLLIDRGVISDTSEAISTEFEKITNDFGDNLFSTINDFKLGLESAATSMEYDTLFVSLRDSLLDIVKQFQASLENVGFSGKQTNEIRDMLRGWNEASLAMLRGGAKDSERAALLNLSKGTVSNSYLYDKTDSFSGKILDELNRLGVGVGGKIGELYDTWLHSHPLKKAEAGLTAFGSDVGASVDDLEIYLKKYFSAGISNMMIANNGKFSKIDWSGLTEKTIKEVISNFKASPILENGKFLSKNATENGKYNLDKQSELINDALIKAMSDAGITDANSRVEIKGVEELGIDLAVIQQEEQGIVDQANELLSVFSKIAEFVRDIKSNIPADTLGVTGITDALKRVLAESDKHETTPVVADESSAQLTVFDNIEENQKNVRKEIETTNDSIENQIVLIDDLNNTPISDEVEVVTGVVEKDLPSTQFSESNKDVYESTQISSNGIYQEGKSAEDLVSKMERAARAKREFVEANKELKSSTDASVIGIEEESQSVKDMGDSANSFSLANLRKRLEELNLFGQDIQSIIKSIEEGSRFHINWFNYGDDYPDINGLKKILSEFGYSIKDFKEDDEAISITGNIISNDDLVLLENGLHSFRAFKDEYEKLSSDKNTRNKTKEYSAQLEILESKLKQLKELVPIEVGNEKQKEILQSLEKEIEAIVSDLKDVKNYTPATQKDIDKWSGRISDLLNKNSAMSGDLKRQFKDLQNQLKRTDLSSVDFDRIKSQIISLEAEMKRLGKTGLSMADKIKKKFKDLIAYFATYVSLQDFIQIMRRGFETIKEYDTALTEMNKVSEESIDTLKKFQKESFKTADSIGTTAIAIQNSVADWQRLGESFEQAKQSAIDANTLFMVSEFDNIDAATESLVAMSQAYDELEKSEINDVLNNIGNNYSIATDELATALQKSAATLKVAGNDIYEASALITAGNAILQDADTVGTGLKMISLRIIGTEDAKNELASLGEDVDDFVVQTKSKIDDTVREYTAVASNKFKGVSILDDNGNYRSTYEILRDISDVYQEILDADRKAGTNRGQALLEVLAGKNRSNVAASILQNPELLTSVYESALESQGSAQKELEKHMQSIEAHLNQLKNAWDNLWINDGNREFINQIVDLGTHVLELVDDFGLLGTAISAAFGYFSIRSAVKGNGVFGIIDAYRDATGEIKKFKEMSLESSEIQNVYKKNLAAGTSALDKYLQSVGDGKASLGGYIKYLYTTADATTGLTLKTQLLRSAISIGLTAAVVLITKAITDYKQAQEEAWRAAVDGASAFKDEQKSLEDVREEYEKLNKKLEDSSLSVSEINSVKEDLLALQKSLIETYGDEALGIDLVNGKYKEQLDLLKNISVEEARKYTARFEGEYKKASALLGAVDEYNIALAHWNSINGKSEDVEKLINYVNNYDSRMKATSTEQTEDGITIGSATLTLEANADDAEKVLTDFYHDIKNWVNANSIDVDISGLLSDIGVQIGKTATDELEEARKIVDQYITAQIMSDDGEGGLRDLYIDSVSAVEAYNEALSKGEGVEEAKKKIEELQRQIREAIGNNLEYKESYDAIFSGINTNQEKRQDVTGKLSELENIPRNIRSDLNDISNLYAIDLEAMNLDDSVWTEQEYAFKRLLNYFGLTNEEAGILIDVLEQLGYILPVVGNEIDSAFKITGHKESIDNFQNNASQIKDALEKIYSGTMTGGDFTDLAQAFPALDLYSGNLADTLRDHLYSELQALYDEFENPPEHLKDALLRTAQEAENAARGIKELTTSMSDLQSAHDLMDTVKNDMQVGKISLSTLQEIASMYPTLSDEVAKYQAGILEGGNQEQALYRLLEKAYQEKFEAYRRSMMSQLEMDETFYNETVGGVEDVLNEKLKAYGIDLEQYGNLAKAKWEVEKALVQDLCDLWNDYYDVAPDEDGYMQIIAKDGAISAPNTQIDLSQASLYGGQWAMDQVSPDYQKIATAYAAASKSVDEYNSFWEVFQKAMNAKFDPITLNDIEFGGDDDKNKSKQLFDWIEKKIERISRRIENLGKTVSDTYSTWGKRNKALAKQIAQQDRLLTVQNKAADKYKEIAETSAEGLSDAYIKKVQQGAMTVEEILTGDDKGNEILVEKIQKYIDNWDKYLEALDAVKDAELELNVLRSQYLDNITTHYENRLSKFENKASMLEAKLAGAESRGIIATQYYYKKLEKNEGENLAVLYGELEAQEVALSHLQAEKGSEEWWKQYNAVQATKLAIQESQNAIKDYQNQLRQTNWDVFDWEREQEAKLMDQADFMLELIDRVDKFDDKGNILDAGITSIGLHGANYNAYLEQSIKYAEELQDLKSQIADTPYDINLIARRDEILEQQQEMILAAEDEKEAIAELVKEGIELQKEALQELIDEYGEALDAQKDLYDQQKKTAQQTKKIADLEKQLAAYSGVQTEEARAKVQELQLALSEERDTLESDQYDQYISDQKEILSSIYDEYEEVMDDYMENTEKMFSDAMAIANNNTKAINSTLHNTADKVNYEVSQDLYDIWNKESGTLATSFDGVKQNLNTNAGVIAGVTYQAGHALLTDLGLVGVDVKTIATDLGLSNEALGRIEKEQTSAKTAVTTWLEGIASNVQSIADKVGAETTNTSDPTKPVLPYDEGSFTNGVKKVDGVTFQYKEGAHEKALAAGDYETNIISRLHWNNFASSLKKRTKMWEEMGISNEPYADTAEQNKQMIEWLKIRGFASGVQNLLRDELAWTQEHGTEAIIRPSDGAILTPLAKGDSVLNAEATSNLWDMMNNPVQFIKDNMATTLAPANVPVLGGRNNTIENSIDLSITLPHVTNYTEFVTALQKDKKFEAMIQDMTVNQLTGVGHLAKYKHKF